MRNWVILEIETNLLKCFGRYIIAYREWLMNGEVIFFKTIGFFFLKKVNTFSCSVDFRCSFNWFWLFLDKKTNKKFLGNFAE